MNFCVFLRGANRFHVAVTEVLVSRWIQIDLPICTDEIYVNLSQI